MFGVGIW